MQSIRITGWMIGIKTVSLVMLVQKEVGSLVEAKRLVEHVLDGGQLSLSFDDPDRARSFGRQARELGAIVDAY